MLFRRGNRKKPTNRTPLMWRRRAPHQGSTVGGLLSVSPPKEPYERRTFCRRGGFLDTPRMCFRWPHYKHPLLLECQRLTLVVSMIIFLLLFFRLGLKVCSCQAVALHCTLHYEYCMFPTPVRDQLNRLYIPLSAAHRVSDSKIFHSFTKIVLDGR
jgi:hypothetical protein